MIIEEIPMDVKIANIRVINKELVSLIKKLEIAEYNLNYSKSSIREDSLDKIHVELIREYGDFQRLNKRGDYELMNTINDAIIPLFKARIKSLQTKIINAFKKDIG